MFLLFLQNNLTILFQTTASSTLYGRQEGKQTTINRVIVYPVIVHPVTCKFVTGKTTLRTGKTSII